MKYDNLIFAQLIEESLLHSNGTFEVTDVLKQRYIEIYSTIKGNGDIGATSNQRYALKLAGLSLLKLNKTRLSTNSNYVKTVSGIVYLISNPAFPGYLKVGITSNLLKRLASYQTYDPFRSYKVEHYKIVENAREYEKWLLKHNNINLAKGEWVEDINVRQLFNE